MDRREYVCNQMYKQHDLLRKGSWTDADKLEYMELNIAPYSRYWRMGLKKALKHAIRLLREEEEKADRKTENSSEKPNNCELQTIRCPKCGRTDYIRDMEKDMGIKGSHYKYKCINCNNYIKTEPTISKMEQVETMSCQECKHFHENAVMYLDQCDFCFKDCKYEPKDEPQTDCSWK